MDATEGWGAGFLWGLATSINCHHGPQWHYAHCEPVVPCTCHLVQASKQYLTSTPALTSYIPFKTVTSWGVTLWVHTSTSQDTRLKLVSWTLTHHPCILGIILRLSYYLLQHFTRCRHMHTCQPLLILLNHSHFSLLCPFNLHCCCNSLRPSDAYMHHKPRPSLVQIMACRLAGAKPSSKPTLEYC